jgi:hypothetical protein
MNRLIERLDHREPLGGAVLTLFFLAVVAWAVFA